MLQEPDHKQDTSVLVNALSVAFTLALKIMQIVYWAASWCEYVFS